MTTDTPVPDRPDAPAPHASAASGPTVVVALDFAEQRACMALVQKLDPALCRLKIGKEMFTLCGPALVEHVQKLGFEVFLDLKFHDIPTTVNKAVAAAASLGVWMVNVHASGGERMLTAAREALVSARRAPLLIAVTVLTSMEDSDLAQLGIAGGAASHAEKLAQLAYHCGLDGVVCSAWEAAPIKRLCADNFLCVTPGIRPAGAEQGDQRRIMTPRLALSQGSDYLVIGRPITQAADPLAALHSIVNDINAQEVQV